VRVEILNLLETREMASPTEMATTLGHSLGVVSYHVRRLAALGFLELVRQTPRRGAIEHHFGLAGGASAGSPPKLPRAVKNAMLGASVESFMDTAIAAAAKGGFDRAEAMLLSRELRLDDVGRSCLNAAMQVWMRRVDEIRDESGARLRGCEPSGTRGTSVSVVLMLFENSPAAAEGARKEQ
jgi:predicted ArsR family transcriptional regulator